MTDKGTAISTGKNRRNNGTAISDSPKPKVDRTKEARKLIIRINVMVNVILDLFRECVIRLFLQDISLEFYDVFALSLILKFNKKRP